MVMTSDSGLHWHVLARLGLKTQSELQPASRDPTRYASHYHDCDNTSDWDSAHAGPSQRLGIPSIVQWLSIESILCRLQNPVEIPRAPAYVGGRAVSMSLSISLWAARARWAGTWKMKKFVLLAILPSAICYLMQIITSQNRPGVRWNVQFAVAKKGLKDMKYDGIQWSTKLERTALRFLYVKNVFNFSASVPNAVVRKNIISSLLRPPESPEEDFSRLSRARLMRLFAPESNFVSSNSIPSNVLSYESFLRCVPAWLKPDAYVFHQDESGKWRVQLRQRVQESGLCYMHAPVVMQSYLISWNSRNAKHPPECEMLDMRRYILSYFSSKELNKHIVTDDGGSSFDYLKKILEQGSKVFHVESADDISASLMEQYGPGLVFQFQVFPEFQLPGRLTYLEESEEEKYVGRHSMLLIGVRMEGNQKVFLLQNWWRNKQFVEVSCRYLKACDARVAFVRTPQTKIPNTLQSRFTVFAETADLDKKETVCQEQLFGRHKVESNAKDKYTD